MKFGGGPSAMIGGYGKKPANDKDEESSSKKAEGDEDKDEGSSLAVQAATKVRRALESGDDKALDKALSAHREACASE